ncbi:MAG: hypothetical protein ABI995_09285 [Acidobacteriota bacterium]
MNGSQDPAFYLYWLRETGCDAGTPIGAGDVPASIRDLILRLTQDGSVAASPAVFYLRLPFFDRNEERHQHQLLPALTYERAGNLIRAVLPPAAATRDMAATCVLADPLWRSTPPERDPAYFPTWRRVSVALQRWLREEVGTAYFSDAGSLEDRNNAIQMVAYQAARPFFGRPRSEFTYDLRDFPSCEATLRASSKLVGRSTQRVLRGIERRLMELGNPRLAHSYSPVWHQDVVVAVRRRPKLYAELLSREAAIINAVIDLGTQPDIEAIDRCAKVVNLQLRSMHGRDMRQLGYGVFEVATQALASKGADYGDHLIDARLTEDADVPSSRRPHSRVSAQE